MSKHGVGETGDPAGPTHRRPDGGSGIRSATPWPGTWQGAVVIFAAWLLTRLAMLVVMQPVGFAEDIDGYALAAQQLVASHGAMLSKRSPAYALFLAPLLPLGTTGIYFCQSLLTLGTALFTSRRLGPWQGIAIAACPFFVIWEWSLMTEPLCLVALWCGWLLLFWRRSRADLLAGGLLLAIAVLTRPILALLPLVASVPFLFGDHKRRAAIILAAAYLPTALMMSRATGPNFLGLNLWIGTWERSPYWMARSMLDWPPEAGLSAQERRRLLAAYDRNDDRPFREAALKRYETKPLRAIESWFIRARFQWISTRTAFTRPMSWLGWFAYKSSMWALNFTMLVLGCIGGALAVRRRDHERILLLPIGYVALAYLPFHSSEDRYSLIVVPFVLALAGHAVALLRSRRWRAPAGEPLVPAR